MPARLRLVLSVLALLPVARAAAAQPRAAESFAPGLIVVSVDKGSSAEQAGLKCGDLIVTLDGAPLRFGSQVNPIWDRARMAGKKRIALTVRTSRPERSLSLAAGKNLGIASRPPLPAPAQQLYDEAVALQDPVVVVARFKASARSAEQSADDRAASWLWLETYRRAPPDSQIEAEALAASSGAADRAGDGLLVASCAVTAGIAATQHGRLDTAEEFFRRALAITQKVAPDSLDLASCLNNLGMVSSARGRLDEAETYYKRVLGFEGRLQPVSLEMASVLNNLGNIAKLRGLFDEAETYLKRALAIAGKLAPISLDSARNLNNLGAVSYDRGRLDEAEAHYKAALAIEEKIEPGSLNVGKVLNNLGTVASGRGRLDESEAYYKRALALEERVAPGSLDQASALNNLANIALDRGRIDEAEAYQSQALAIDERAAPGSLDLAATLTNLGNIAYSRGRLDEAEAYHKRALAIEERLSPESLNSALSYSNLGSVSYKRGSIDQAEAYHKRALAIRQTLAPESLDVAKSENSLGLVDYGRGRLDEAEAHFRDAWKIVRRQAGRISRDSARQEFGSANAFYAANLVATQVQRGESDAAFLTLEEGRTQALLQSMADRNVTERVTPKDVWSAYQSSLQRHNVALMEAERAAEPVGKAQALLAAVQERKADVAALQQAQRALDDANRSYEPKFLAEARTREEETGAWEEVRKASGAAAPAALDPNQARKRLPAGTLLLEFSVANENVTLFAVTREKVEPHVLAVTRKELEPLLLLVRKAAARDVPARDAEEASVAATPADELAAEPALIALYQKLFPPDVQQAIQSAKRIVVSPDDLLWALPFAALLTSDQTEGAYLGLEKPLSYTQSLAVLLLTAPESKPTDGVLVVGNPLYDNQRRAEMVAAAKARKPLPGVGTGATLANASGPRSGDLGMLTRDGRAPAQLPGAEEEAEQVAALYHSAPRIGAEATESWFRQQAATARVLHLATHGYLHPYAAMSSGVLLAVPDQPEPWPADNDGALQAWEVWSLKLNAELVVLSACETGRGVTVSGEGLIGLTRAWQYAGARTVVSSQWKVSDASTAALMVAFHKHLLEGMERDEALRLAMVDVAGDKSGRWSSPYHWAAFVLVGETGRMR